MAMQTYSNIFWGGINVRDQADSLILHSHTASQAGWYQTQRIGVESPLSENMDFGPEEIRKRLGSASYTDLTSVMISGDTLISGVEFEEVSSGDRIILIASTKTFYTNDSGSFAQINDSDSAAYTHTADITKCKFVLEDGRVFAGCDGANKIQVYKGGADLDDELHNNSSNTYETSYSGATDFAISGTWGTGYTALGSLHGRLCFGNDSVLEFTPMSRVSGTGIGELGDATAGAYFAQGRIKMVESFTPHNLDDVDAVLYVGTSAGVEMITGFAATDFSRVVPNAGAPINHQCFFKSLNWFVYLTTEGEILGINGSRIINLGARLKTPDSTGPLDDFNESASATTAFGFYNRDKQQGIIAFSTDSAHVNDTMIVIDFKEGEPIPGEPEQSWERRVRLLKWQIKNPDTQDWFVHIFQRTGAATGIMSDGTTWTLDSGDDDLGSIAVESKHRIPIFTGGQGLEHYKKQWYRADFGNLSTGNWTMTVKVFVDRDPNPVETYTFNQTQAGAFILGTSVLGDDLLAGGLVADFHRLQQRSETIQLEFSDTNTGQPFKVATLGLTYEVGALRR